METAKWLIFSHWASNETVIRMDCTAEPVALLEHLLFANSESLVVIKAFQAASRREQELAERFADCHKFDHWYALRPGLKRFLETEAVCETLILKKQCALEHRRLRWSAAAPDKQQMLAEARMDHALPSFVRNAERFVMWAIDDLAEAKEQCFPSLVIKHPANRFYKPRTIYNTINRLTEQGKIVKLPSRRLELSNGGQQEIDGLKKVEELKEKKRRGTLRV
jgi:hypothetical protein